ncbi:MAG: hypothetical protein ACLSHO_10985 [Dysosmobacter sp.]
MKLEPEKVNGLLGTDVSRRKWSAFWSLWTSRWRATPFHVPSWRSDVEHYSDIAEEVARFYGYNSIPDTLSAGRSTAPRLHRIFSRRKNLLAALLPPPEYTRDHHSIPSSAPPIMSCQDRPAQGPSAGSPFHRGKILTPWGEGHLHHAQHHTALPLHAGDPDPRTTTSQQPRP